MAGVTRVRKESRRSAAGINEKGTRHGFLYNGRLLRGRLRPSSVTRLNRIYHAEKGAGLGAPGGLRPQALVEDSGVLLGEYGRSIYGRTNDQIFSGFLKFWL